MKSPLPFICCLFSLLSLFAHSLFSQEYKKPEFIGGKGAFYKYLDKYLVFPAAERERGTRAANLEATIYISKEGKVKFVNVTGESTEFKSQVKKILTLMPEWNAGIFKAQPVDTFIVQKVWFSYGESRIKKDSSIYEFRVYGKPVTDVELVKWEQERQANALKLASAKEVYNTAAIEFNKGNFVEATRLFNEAKIKGLESTDLYFNLAVAQLKSGDKESACPNFKEAARKGDQEAYNLYLKMCK